MLGTMIGVGGGVWNIYDSNKKEKKEQEINAMIQKMVEDDNNLQEDVRSELSKFEILDHTEKHKYMEALFVIAKGWGASVLSFGPLDAKNLVLECLSPVVTRFTGIEFKPILEAVAKNAPILIAQGTKEVADAQLRATVETASKELGHPRANIVGEITTGLGVISCVWDAYQISQAWEGSKEGAQTKLGIALRRIASQLENQMLNRSGG